MLGSNKTREQDLRDSLTNAQAAIKELNAEFERIGENGLAPATVIVAGKKRALIAKGGDIVSIIQPKKDPLTEGDSVLVTRDSNQFLEKLDIPILGELTTVVRELDDRTVEVSVAGTMVAVMRGNITGIKEGDRVILDKSRSIVLRRFDGEGTRFEFNVETHVTWNDIGGHEHAKEELIEAIELPHKHPDVFKFYSKKPIKGVLLEGPPGCGKTMLGKAVATSMNSNASGFLYVKGAEVLDPYVGVAEATVRSVFATAKEYKARTGKPAVIYFDEAEAIFGNRNGKHAMMEKTIVPTFLAEMDGLDESGAIVILATNHASSLDPAVTREGRMDRKVRISRPTKKDAAEIVKLYLNKVPTAPGHEVDELVEATCELIYSNLYTYYDVMFATDDVKTFGLSNLVSGAMLAGIVDQASSLALRRDLKSGSKPLGVSIDDVIAAIDKVYKQNRNVDHADALHDFANGRNILNVIKRGAVYAEST